MSSWQSDALDGVCQRLAGAGCGTWAPDAGGGTIWRGAIPPDATQGIGVQGYRVGPDDPAHPTTSLRVQLWLRAPDIATLDDLDANSYDALIGLNDAPMGTVTVTDVGTISSLPQGTTETGEYERSVNYALELDLPDTALRSYARN